MHMALPLVLQVMEETHRTSLTPEELVKREAKHRDEIKEAEANAAFAKREESEGFPVLLAHTLVGLWGALEAAIKDSMVGMLSNEPILLQIEALAKIRVPLAQFETLDKEERMRLLIEELKRSQGFAGKQGADGFEALLGHVNLSGRLTQK